jgi:hypothetical protein
MSNAQEDAAKADAKRRRARLVQIEVENEYGRQLVDRYGNDVPRPQSAHVKYGNMKRRRR